MDERILKHAEILSKYSLDIKKGERLLIWGDIVTFPLIKEIYCQTLKLGAFPQLNITSDEIREISLKHGANDQLKYVPESMLKMVDEIDAGLVIQGASNTRILSQIDAEKIKIEAQGNSVLAEKIFEKYGKGKLKWCETVFPNQAAAQEADMSLVDYENFFYRSLLIDYEDPVKKWKEIDVDQERICSLLDKKKNLKITSKGTELSMAIEGRKWVNCAGKLNLPDGEIFTAPIEDSVEGTIRFSFPGIIDGREIEDIQLTFKKGKVIEAKAKKGSDLLHQLLDTDEGAKYVGEIAVGTNFQIKKFTRNMMFDEKLGGTIHLALGRSIPGSRGQNKSAIHWDLICDMEDSGEIYADGELIYRQSKFI